MVLLIKLVLAWIALTPIALEAGIQSFDLVLLPTEEFVHYNDGFIRGPGSIDLSQLTFTAISEAFISGDDDMMYNEFETSPEDDVSINPTDDQPPLRMLRLDNNTMSTDRFLDGGIENDGTAVDIAIFPLPSKCANTRKGCDWVELGVGMRLDGALRWCCSDEALQLGLCTDAENNHGRLMIDQDKFKGSHRFVTVPSEGPMSKKIRFGNVEVQESATYVVLYANCNTRGREIKITGDAVWKSKHGYLPGELFGFMYFYTMITIVYFLLFFWFGALMQFNEDNRIEIEKWILFAITLGLLEMIFRTGDYFVWNSDGIRSSFIIWIGILAGVLKQGISRCLIVMVSLGWGVVRDSLGTIMRTIIIVGMVYIGTSSAIDLMLLLAVDNINKFSVSEEQELFDAVEILTFVKAAVDAIMIMWIFDALSNTMAYLENMNQTRKLDRFLKLRCIFLFSVLFSVVWAVFSLVDKYNDDGIIAEEHAWAIDAASEINYLFVLIGVAYLWRPNENARQYAYVMELSAGIGDDNELELTGNVPSALDDDDADDVPAGNGYHDEPKEINRFEIS